MLIPSSPYNTQSNGLPERMNRTLLNKIQLLIKESKLDRRYWSGTVRHVKVLQNRTTNIALEKRTTREILFRNLPDNFAIRKFGYTAYLYDHKEMRTSKLADLA